RLERGAEAAHLRDRRGSVRGVGLHVSAVVITTARAQRKDNREPKQANRLHRSPFFVSPLARSAFMVENLPTRVKDPRGQPPGREVASRTRCAGPTPRATATSNHARPRVARRHTTARRRLPAVEWTPERDLARRTPGRTVIELVDQLGRDSDE